MTSTRHRHLALGIALALPAAVLAGCATDEASPAASSDASEHGHDHDEHEEGGHGTEAATDTPRIALTYDGGIVVLDGTSLEQVADLPVDGFTRINPAGDERHVIVSAGDAFRVLDLGTWGEPHGNHSHFYTSEPAFTQTEFAANHPGHVVRHAGRTVLFNDGSGLVESFDPHDLADGDPETTTYTTPSPHHGVAVELESGDLLVTDGTEDSRSSVVVLDSGRHEVARTDACPGVHGEAVASDEAVVVGCEDGVVVYAGGELTKIASPDAYGRIGNQAGSDESPVVLGDYKSDPDAELERPTRVSLVDTVSRQITLVDTGASYTFRSLGRGPHGEALVLGTDGALRVIDPASGAVTSTIAVIDAWTEPDDWQAPRPTLFVLDHTAYVTDPATKAVHAVDVESGKVYASTTLDVVPNELTGVSGLPE
ncbi:zinc metallochaperone AztD [Oerskovia enterophila]|uniref:zinc metallochaperone AztD n=1 Tax=Oerskovia enterophila TaxID=43678 RepID=UPI00380BFEE3